MEQVRRNRMRIGVPTLQRKLQRYGLGTTGRRAAG